MSTRDPRYGTHAADPLTPTGEQGSTNEAERTDATPGTAGSWTSSDYLDSVGQRVNTAGSQDQESASQGMADQAQEKASDLGHKAQEMGHTAQEKAADMGHMAQDKADQGLDAAASGLGQAASMLRQQGSQREGAVGEAAARTADTLESASSYLRDTDTSQLLDDVEAFVRQRPVESVLIAAGIGFVLSKIVK